MDNNFHIFPSETFIDLCLYQYGHEKCTPGHLFGPATRNHSFYWWRQAAVWQQIAQADPQKDRNVPSDEKEIALNSEKCKSVHPLSFSLCSFRNRHPDGHEFQGAEYKLSGSERTGIYDFSRTDHHLFGRYSGAMGIRLGGV